MKQPTSGRKVRCCSQDTSLLQCDTEHTVESGQPCEYQNDAWPLLHFSPVMFEQPAVLTPIRWSIEFRLGTKEFRQTHVEAWAVPRQCRGNFNHILLPSGGHHRAMAGDRSKDDAQDCHVACSPIVFIYFYDLFFCFRSVLFIDV